MSSHAVHDGAITLLGVLVVYQVTDLGMRVVAGD